MLCYSIIIFLNFIISIMLLFLRFGVFKEMMTDFEFLFSLLSNALFIVFLSFLFNLYSTFLFMTFICLFVSLFYYIVYKIKFIMRKI